VGDHGVIEVDAAQALQADGLAERLEAGGGAPQHGGVERPAAEVVDGHDVARSDARRGGVVDGCGDGLGDEADVAQVAARRRMTQEIELELAPVRRVGEGDGVRWTALALGDVGQDVA
jgi:hypothetical protein